MSSKTPISSDILLLAFVVALLLRVAIAPCANGSLVVMDLLPAMHVLNLMISGPLVDGVTIKSRLWGSRGTAL